MAIDQIGTDLTIITNGKIEITDHHETTFRDHPIQISLAIVVTNVDTLQTTAQIVIDQYETIDLIIIVNLLIMLKITGMSLCNTPMNQLKANQNTVMAITWSTNKHQFQNLKLLRPLTNR